MSKIPLKPNSGITLEPFKVNLVDPSHRLKLEFGREHQDFNVDGTVKDMKMDLAWRTDWPDGNDDEKRFGFHAIKNDVFLNPHTESTAIWELETVPKWSGTVKIKGGTFTLETIGYRQGLTEKVVDPRNYRWENTMSLDVDADEKPNKLSLFTGSPEEEPDNDGLPCMSFDVAFLFAALLLREIECLFEMSHWSKLLTWGSMAVRCCIPFISIYRRCRTKPRFKWETHGYILLYLLMLLVAVTDLVHYGFENLGGHELVKEFLIGFYDDALEVNPLEVGSSHASGNPTETSSLYSTPSTPSSAPSTWGTDA